LRAEITLNGLQLSVLDLEILHVPERFTVRGVAKILRQSAPGIGDENVTFPVPEIQDLHATVKTVSAFGYFSCSGPLRIRRAKQTRLPIVKWTGQKVNIPVISRPL
jgi:hypothetical protein